MVPLALLILGLAGLCFGSHAVVVAAVRIADRYGISARFIGLTILAVGTDLPETVVAVSATLDKLRGTDTSGLILGNAIGSAVTQISVVIGIAALAGAVALSRRHVVMDGFALLVAVGFVATLGVDGALSRLDGVVLLLAYAIYYVTLWGLEAAAPRESGPIPGVPWADLGRLLVGLVVLVAAAEITVTQSIVLAERWGVAPSFVAIVIVGLGTSLPELAISVKAALDRRPGLSVGNIVGSNIFDLLVPVGIGAAGARLTVEKGLLGFDLVALFAVSVIAMLLLLRRRGLPRSGALLLIGIYGGYVAIKIAGAVLGRPGDG